MNTHETYVSLEVAKLLKQAGFDWDCEQAYFIGSSMDSWIRYGDLCDVKTTIINKDMLICAPALSIAQKWLREVKKVHIEASPENDEYTEWLVCVYDSNHTAYSGYETYEGALEAGIKKCLEIILEE